MVRELDDTRMVMLNSGRWDQQGESDLGGLEIWRMPDATDPNVTRNGDKHPLTGLGITWQPGQLALHPGPKGEYSVVRWTCPAAGEHAVDGRLHRHRRSGHHRRARPAQRPLAARRADQRRRPGQRVRLLQDSWRWPQGDTLDFVVGFGNGFYGGDTTALAAPIRSADGTGRTTLPRLLGRGESQRRLAVRLSRARPRSRTSATLKLYAVGKTLGERSRASAA